MEQFIFLGQKSENKPISRIQAFRIISSAAKKCLLSQKVSCHSLRKTFGYHAWKKGVSPALLTSIVQLTGLKFVSMWQLGYRLCLEMLKCILIKTISKENKNFHTGTNNIIAVLQV